MLATGALTVIFTRSREMSDFWADALKVWWLSVKDQPMATLAMAVTVGFVLGALWKS